MHHAQLHLSAFGAQNCCETTNKHHPLTSVTVCFPSFSRQLHQLQLTQGGGGLNVIYY